MISGIIKVEVSVISRSRRMRLITLTMTLIIPDITKTASNNCFLTHCFEENNDKRILLKIYRWSESRSYSYFIAWQWKRSILGLHCHAIKNKSHNHSITLLKKLGYDRWLIYEQPRQDLGLCGFLLAHYSEKCFTQIYKALYGEDAILVPFWGAPT